MDRAFFRDRLISLGAASIRRLEAFIAWGSRVGNPPVFDASLFPWSRNIEVNWSLIRRELDDILTTPEILPPFQEISKDQRVLTTDNRWLTYFFYAFGYKATKNCDRCPETARLVETIPGMTTAFFSILSPGKHLPPHRGAFKGILRYHIGLLIPEPQDLCGINVGDRLCHWQEGKSLIFDDTYIHEAWNDTDKTRAVLFVDFVRPLRFPVNVVNWAVIQAIKHSPFVTDAVSNYQAWEKKFDQPAAAA